MVSSRETSVIMPVVLQYGGLSRRAVGKFQTPPSIINIEIYYSVVRWRGRMDIFRSGDGQLKNILEHILAKF